MRSSIAIVGGGIAGNVLAYRLHADHDVTLFEANDYLGGHTHTHELHIDGREVAVDSGFIVFNDWTYPNFIGLLDELGVDWQDSDMSFSVRCESSGLEYNGTSLNTLFAQRRNLLSPGFIGMLRDILRFNREALRLLEEEGDEFTLGEYLYRHGYGQRVVDHYIVPMGAAIWSTDPALMLDFPARFFIRFLHNHGMLSIDRRPQWRVVRGGSKRYLEAMSRGYADRVRLAQPVRSIRRDLDGVRIAAGDEGYRRFDRVFLACHSDQALAVLADPSDEEREILGALPYQRNRAVLHTDLRKLPRSRRAWAAWNYHLPAAARGSVGVTYSMNILQGLDLDSQVLVTLNDVDDIDPARVIRRMEYDHPLFTVAGAAAQRRRREISGVNGTYYAGAYWRNGFHEDGVVSALDALEDFNRDHGNAQLHLRRAG